MAKGIRFQFCKGAEVRFLSHLDLLRTMERALRRAQLPIAFSGGFSPKAKMGFASALPVGILSRAEYADFWFQEVLDPREFVVRYNAHLPGGLRVVKAAPLDPNTPALMAVIRAAEYELVVAEVKRDELAERLRRLMALDTFLLERRTKKGLQKINVRPLLWEILELGSTPGGSRLLCRCAAGQKGNLRMEELGAMLGFDHRGAKITRTALLLKDGKIFRQPLEKRGSL